MMHCNSRHVRIETGGIVQGTVIHAARLTLANAVQELDLIIGNDQLLW